jgi:hypothetical protein
VERTYIVCIPSERLEGEHVKASVALLKVPSLAVHAFQLPLFVSIEYCTLATVPTASVAEPENTGELLLFGSGDRGVRLITGGVASETVNGMDISMKVGVIVVSVVDKFT